MTHNENTFESGLPPVLAKPAIRALAGSSYLQRGQFTKLREAVVYNYRRGT